MQRQDDWARRLVKASMLAAIWGLLAPGVAQATTLYWGGGTNTMTGGVSVLNPTNGTWDTATANWGDQASATPANYYVWTNAAGNVANVGARAFAQTISVWTGGVASAGLNLYVLDGGGAGVATLQGASSSASVFAPLAFNDNAVMNIATGTTLKFSSSGGNGYNLALSFTNLTITGGGTFYPQFYGGSISSTGSITVSNATFYNYGSYPFGTAALNLSGANARYINERGEDWGGCVWSAINGTGYFQSSSAGLRALGLNNPADATLSIQILNGSVANCLAVLYKTGLGKLTVMNSSNAYFGNYVRQGMLTPGASNAVNGWVLVDGLGTTPGIFATPDSTSFSGGVTADSGGQINGANLALSQIQLMAGGAVLYNAPGEIPGTGRVLSGAQPGAVIACGYAFDSNFLQRIQESFDGVIALGANIGSGTTLSFSNAAAGGAFSKARLGAWGATRTFDGTLVPNAGAYRLGGGNAMLTLTAPLTGTGSLDVSDGPNKQFFGQGFSAQNGAILTANNTLSGPVTIGHGSTLVLSNATGRLSGATGVTITGGGALVLTDSASGSQNDRIPSVEVALRNGGTFNLTGAGNATEAIGALTIDGGYNAVLATRATGGGTTYLQVDRISPTNWGVVNFSYNSTQIKCVTAPAADGAMLGPWASVGTKFAVWQTNNGGQVVAMPATSYTNVTTDAIWQTCGPNTNVIITGSFPATTSKTVASVGVGNNLTANWTGTNTVVSGGILGACGGNNSIFTNGAWTSAAADRGLYVYNIGTFGVLTLYSDLVDNGPTAVTVVVSSPPVAGVAVALSSTNNTFSGGVVVNNGILRATTAAALGTGASLVLNGIINSTNLTTLDLSGTDVRALNQNITVNADALILNSNTGTGGSDTFNGGIALNNNSLLTLGTYNSKQPIVVNGAVSGSGSLRLRAYNANTITLAGSTGNSYTGDTYVAGPVTLNKSSGDAIPGNVYFGTVETINGFPQRPMLVLAQNNQIADTAVLTFGGGQGGTNTAYLSPILRFAGKSDTLAGLNSLVGNGVVENGSNTTVATLTLAGSGTYAFGGLIWNGSGTGTQALVQAGSGTQTLAGASLYTGGTTVNAGTLLVRNAAGSGTGGGNVTVASNGTLGGDGRIVPATNRTVAVSGTLAPGVGSSGSLTVDFGSGASNLTLNGGATLAYTVGAPGTSGMLAFQNVRNGKVIFNNTTIKIANAGGLAIGSYTLMSFYSNTGTTLTDTGKPTSGLVAGALPGGLSGRIDYSQTGKIVLQVISGGTALLVR